ncbi:hypothetical protein SFRURICE_008885 [Spodoptera frugiperda]|nr:hypothetical protein SFRURICE_008885 [Spodoptera frugiperda]
MKLKHRAEFTLSVTKMAATVATGRCSGYTTFDIMALWLDDNSRLRTNRQHQIEWSNNFVTWGSNLL